MAALGSLVVSLEANTAKFTAGMDKAAYETQKAAQKMQRDAQMVGTAMGVMGVAAVGALGVMVKSSLDAMDSMSKMAQKTGTTVESLSALSYAAGLSGIGTDALGSAMVKLSKGMSDAHQGTGEAIKGFAALGISVTNADGSLKDSDKVISEVAEKLSVFRDGANKTAIAVSIFGKSGAELIPLLNGGADGIKTMTDEAARYGLVMGTEAAKAAEQFNDDLSRLQQTQTAFANAVTVAVLPVLQAVATEFLGATGKADGFATAGAAVRTVLETFVVIGSEVAFVFKGVGTEIGGMAAQIAALARGDFKGFSAIAAAMREDAEKARQEHDAFIATVMDRTPKAGAAPSASGGGLRAAPALVKTPTGGAPKQTEAQKIEADAQRFVARLKEQAETYGKTDLAALQYQMSLSNFPQIYKDEALALQARIDAMKAKEVANKKAIQDDIDAFKIMDDLRIADEKAVQKNEANVRAIRVGLMSEAEQEAFAHEAVLAELTIFHDAKLANVVLANQLIEEENARHQQALSDMQAARDLQSLAMAGSTADQFYGLLQKAGQEQSALGKAVFLASKAIAVAEILLNTEVAAAKAGAQLGIFGIPMAVMIRATGYASAGMVAGMAIAGMREKGGPVWAGGAFLVGERGPEVFQPTGHGNIIPNSALGGKGGEGNITIVNNTSAKIGKVTEQRISPTERALIIQEAVGTTAAQLNDPNSRMSRSMGQSYMMQRSR